MARELPSAFPWGPVMGCMGMVQGFIHLDIRKPVYFNDSVIKYCNRTPRHVLHAPNQSMFSRHLDYVLNNMQYLLVSPKVVRQLDCVMADIYFPTKILWFNVFFSNMFCSVLFRILLKISANTLLPYIHAERSSKISKAIGLFPDINFIF